jgi:hypothetical protein
MKKLILFFLISFSSHAIVYKPSDYSTKGSFCEKRDSDFKEFRHKEKIPVCDRNVSDGLKKKVFFDYGIPENEQSTYTIDHRIPLFLGGSNHQDNLWPQSRLIYTGNLEMVIFGLLKKGIINQKEGLSLIMSVK